MTVETTSRKQTFAGGQTTLTFSFRALTSTPSDIKVLKTLISTGAETVLTYGVDYTVSINSDGVGGTVTLSPTFSTSYTQTVYRETTLTQESDYDDYNQFPADTLETNLDKITMIVQDQDEIIDRSLVLPISVTGATTSLPVPSSNTLLGWNSAATAIENKVLSALGALAKASTSDAQGATDDANYMTAAKVKTEVEFSGAVTIPSNNLGVVAVTKGGTGISTYAIGDILCASTSTLLIKVTPSPTAGTALLSNGTGAVPSYGSIALNQFVGNFTRDMTSTSGTVAITGVGFSPRVVLFTASKASAKAQSTGWDNGTNHACIYDNEINSASHQWENSALFSIFLTADVGTDQRALISSMDSDGFTLSWTKTASPSAGSSRIVYVALR